MERKVTALKQQKHNPNRANVYLDGEFAFGLVKVLAGGLHIGQMLSPEKIAELQGQDAYEEALQKAYHFISYRPRSESEIQQHLEKHEVPPTAIEAVLQRLKELEVANDKRFAQLWVDNRSEFRPRGRRQLRMELRQKGLDDKIIEHALAEVDEEPLALQAARQRAHRLQGLPIIEFKQKLYAYLARRGFNHEAITQAIQQAWAELHSQSNTDQEDEETTWK